MSGIMTTSWDDGDARDGRVADLLERYGLSGTFYVPRRAPNTVMADAEVRRLAERFEIGAHTLTHPRLTTLDETRARDEIVGSKKWVEDLTGRPCTMFCPPEGKFLPLHRGIARDAGYQGFRTVELMSVSAPTRQDDLLVMPTSIQAQPHPRSAYLRNALKRRSIRGLYNFALAGASADWSTLAKRMVARVAKVGGVFHLWGHSWEIDAFGQWGPLESVLECMASHRATLSAKSNSELCGAAV